MTLPGRSLAIVYVNNDLKAEQNGQLYEIEPNHLLIEEYPNLYIIPMMHNVDAHKTENYDMEELKEQNRKNTLENIEKKFITSPADIDVH